MAVTNLVPNAYGPRTFGPQNWSPIDLSLWTNGPQPIQSPWKIGPQKLDPHGQMVPNQFGPPGKIVPRIFHFSRGTGYGDPEIGKLGNRGITFIGDHLSRRTKFLGTVCPWGPNLIGTICQGGSNLWGLFVQVDRKRRTGSQGTNGFRTSFNPTSIRGAFMLTT